MSKEVTYQQYRDAAYRYNAATEKMIREEKELEEAKESLEKKREELKQVESLITHNRTQKCFSGRGNNYLPTAVDGTKK